MLFKKYKRRAIAELRGVTTEEVQGGVEALKALNISVSVADIDNGSPRIEDMIARNPINHNDQWLVAKDYFLENFEEV